MYNSDQMLTSDRILARFNISERTLRRWRNDPMLKFPASRTIRGRHYWDCDELLAFEQRTFPLKQAA